MVPAEIWAPPALSISAGSSAGERRSYKPQVAGSSPAPPTRHYLSIVPALLLCYALGTVGTALYCTADSIGAPGGGGQVARHELEALRELFPGGLVLGREQLTPHQYAGLDIPFLQDYFALGITQAVSFDLAHFYSGTFSETVKELRRREIPVTYTCPAHDRAASIREFQAWHGAYPFQHLSDPALWDRFSAGLRAASLVIVPSTYSADVLMREGVSQENLVVIPHGAMIPHPEVTGWTAPRSDQTFRVGYLGQTGPDKGLVYLIQAWGLAGIDGELVLAGRGTELLESLVRRYVPRGTVRLLGWLDDAGLSQFWGSIDVYCQPSVSESFGIEVLEAMGHGRPVIVTDGVGAKDLIKLSPESPGFVVPARSPVMLAETLSQARARLADKRDGDHYRADLAQRARAVAERHTWEKTKMVYQDVWRGLAKHAAG